MRFRLWRSGALLLVAIGCVALLVLSHLQNQPVLAQATSPEPAITETTPAPNFQSHFQELGVDGSILIYDLNNNQTYQHNPQRNTTAYFPASTFKIFNALVALETGVIRDDVTVLTWDGISRGLLPMTPIAAWNQDTNLRQAFKNSTIWFYQVLARKAGVERMQQFINQVGYGNQQIGTAETIDHFWLDGPLKITAEQQIEFLQRLYQGDLPFSERSINLVKNFMVLEQTPSYTLRGKSGWTTSLDPHMGLLVGYLEQNDNVYFFATNIDMPNPDDAPKRIDLTRRCLTDLGLL